MKIGLVVCAGALAALSVPALSVPALSQPGPAAAERLNQPGKEQAMLANEVGEFDVIATMYPPAGGAPIMTRGLIARRTMIGPYLQEIMEPAPGSPTPAFKRIDYLNYDRVEGRWKYVSMDTRFPVSIMPAASFGPAVGGAIRLFFAPQGFVGLGPAVEGRFMVSDMTIRFDDGRFETKEQMASFATGDGVPRAFVRYEYSRR